MHKIRVENACSCFFKSGLFQMLEFDTKEEAKSKAQEMVNIMKLRFCKKHDFSLNEAFGDYTIFIKSRA
jgi:hypothetical protein